VLPPVTFFDAEYFAARSAHFTGAQQNRVHLYAEMRTPEGAGRFKACCG
jgi:hypothetical protein